MWWWNLTNWLTLWCHWPTTPSASPLQQRNPPPNTVMSAPLRHPSVAGTEHIDTLSACGPRHRRSPAMEFSRHVDVSVHTGPQPTLPSTHSKPTSSFTPIAPVTGGGGGGCSGDTCVTQACSVYPAVCFNGSLFLYTPDRCVLVAWMRACVRALDRAREQLIVPGMSALLLLCNQYRSLRDSVLLRQSSRRYCVLHCPGLWHWQTCILMALRQL